MELRIAIMIAKLSELFGVPRPDIQRRYDELRNENQRTFTTEAPEWLLALLAKRCMPKQPADRFLFLLLELRCYIEHLEERCGLSTLTVTPVDLEAERDVIGGLLFGCGVSAMVEPEDFAEPVRERLYEAWLRSPQDGDAAEPTEDDAAGRRLIAWLDQLDPGDTEALDELSRQVKLGPVPSVVFEESAKAVRRCACTRRRAALGMKIVNDAADVGRVSQSAKELVAFRGEI